MRIHEAGRLSSKFAGWNRVDSKFCSRSNTHVANMEIDRDLEFAADGVVLGACWVCSDEARIVEALPLLHAIHAWHSQVICMNHSRTISPSCIWT